ncbi:hypothetical protein SAMN04487861_12812 [Selenomonas ruminantium]|uniref:Uncharacterized protein n=1 Tax=Selenomonas ruminantium TaxID=971 RepID=A0A1I3H845_SELRU|nr:hypothetical protein [Selenomonas ruminantium]SFI31843.1 hypothetical protein SAMN04487861_12812 [Selenomonas ruminantium]
MTRLLELFGQYKILMMLVLLLIIGGIAFYLGQSSASPAEEAQVQTVQKESHTNKKDDAAKAENSADEAADKANAKTEADIEKMAKQLDEHKKEVEEDKSNGTVENGTVKMAPPKFTAPKDLKVRQADFKD